MTYITQYSDSCTVSGGNYEEVHVQVEDHCPSSYQVIQTRTAQLHQSNKQQEPKTKEKRFTIVAVF